MKLKAEGNEIFHSQLKFAVQMHGFFMYFSGHNMSVDRPLEKFPQFSLTKGVFGPFSLWQSASSAGQIYFLIQESSWKLNPMFANFYLEFLKGITS